MATGSAYGYANALGSWWATGGCTDNAAATLAVHGQGVNSIRDASGAGNYLKLHSGKTAGLLATYASPGATSGAVQYGPDGGGHGVMADDRPYADILFDAGSIIYDLPAGAMPTAAGSNNPMTIFHVVRGGYLGPMVLGGDATYHFGFGYTAGASSAGASLTYGFFQAGAGWRRFANKKWMDPYNYTVMACVCTPSQAAAMYINQTDTDTCTGVSGNPFNNPCKTDGNNTGTIGGYLGGYPGSGTEYFEGWWAGTVLFNVALTNTQILDVIKKIMAQMGMADDHGKNTLGIVGDSLMKGPNTGTSFSQSPSKKLATLMGPSYAVIDLAIPGSTLSQINTQATNLASYALGGGKKVALYQGGSNDANTGSSAATIEGLISSGVGGLAGAGWQTIVATITNRGAAGGAVNTVIAAVNTWVVGTLCDGNAKAVANWAGDARLATATDQLFFDTDNIHTIAAGSTIKAMLINNAVQTLVAPGPGNVRSGVSFNLGSTGLLNLPAVAHVRLGIVFDNGSQTGVLDLPAISDVRDAVNFDGGVQTGTLAVPDPSDVRSGVDFDDTASPIPGTLVVPAVADVRFGVAFDNIHVSTGALDLPSTGDVRAGVVFDNGGQNGALDLPNVDDVRFGVVFDNGGQTGTLVASSIPAGELAEFIRPDGNAGTRPAAQSHGPTVNEYNAGAR